MGVDKKKIYVHKRFLIQHSSKPAWPSGHFGMLRINSPRSNRCQRITNSDSFIGRCVTGLPVSQAGHRTNLFYSHNHDNKYIMTLDKSFRFFLLILLQNLHLYNLRFENGRFLDLSLFTIHFTHLNPIACPGILLL